MSSATPKTRRLLKCIHSRQKRFVSIFLLHSRSLYHGYHQTYLLDSFQLINVSNRAVVAVGHLYKELRAQYISPPLDPTPGEGDVAEVAQLREDDVQVPRWEGEQHDSPTRFP